jgi:hypothetical protein
MIIVVNILCDGRPGLEKGVNIGWNEQVSAMRTTIQTLLKQKELAFIKLVDQAGYY